GWRFCPQGVDQTRCQLWFLRTSAALIWRVFSWDTLTFARLRESTPDGSGTGSSLQPHGQYKPPIAPKNRAPLSACLSVTNSNVPRNLRRSQRRESQGSV